nr:uncharacterized protein LOC117842595 [Setaria viridis]
MPPPPLRVPPHLPDEVVEDILVRVPADDPARLLRSALTCKRWARLMANRGFRRRYRERYRGAPPVLGVLANLTLTGGVARFIPNPTCGFRPARDDLPGYRAHDARHGRVLLNRLPGTPAPHRDQESALAVWDPTTDQLRQLPLLKRPHQVLNWNAAVLCGADAGAACDHLDCHAGPFRVVFVGIDSERIFASVYSSEFGAWSDATSADHPGDDLDIASPGALAGNAIHFVFLRGTRVLKYDLGTRKMYHLRLPRMLAYGSRIVLMAMEDGKLGFAELWLQYTVLRLWSLELSPNGLDGAWVLGRSIELNKHLPADAFLPGSMPCVVAFADGAGIIFLKMIDGLYGLDLKSARATKISMASGFYDIVPFVSFYIPVLRAALVTSGEESSVGSSSP